MTDRATAPPIAGSDRVSDVLARDESLVEVFVRAAPHFAKLRNRAMRRVMARLVTVEQAARMAGVSVETLVRDLNEAAGLTAAERDATPLHAGPSARTPQAAQAATSPEPPSHRPPHAPVVTLDVRDDLRAGREPFSRIMAAVAALREGEVLCVRATFEPVPLVTVMAKRGFAHESQASAPDDWSVWFWRRDDVAIAPPAAEDHPPTPSPAAPSDPGSPEPIWLDVRGLEPPEPLVRTLAALEELPPGRMLIQINARVPQFLLPVLAERGFACEIDDSAADRVLVRIWRPT